MRTVWKTGSATGVPPNYRGRYCTPWREDPDSVFNEDGQGVDNPSRYPFDPMDLRQFTRAMWRVRTYEITWAVSFLSFASGFAFNRAGTVECVATALNPQTGSFEAIGPQEEYRLGAGFTFDGDQTYEDPEFGGSEVTILASIGGIHQYHCPTATLTQRFRPAVAFSYNIALTEGGSEQFSFGVAASRTGAVSQGVSRLLIPSPDPEVTASYESTQICVGNALGTTFFIGPGTISGSVTIRSSEWWEYRDGDGQNSIWDSLTGAQLREWRTQASREASGIRVARVGAIPSPSWVA